MNAIENRTEINKMENEKKRVREKPMKLKAFSLRKINKMDKS